MENWNEESSDIVGTTTGCGFDSRQELEIVELYLHSPIRLHGVEVNEAHNYEPLEGDIQQVYLHLYETYLYVKNYKHGDGARL
jgi:hypothetical protein